MTVKNYVLDINKTSLQHPSIVLRQDDYNIYTVNISVTENGVPVNLGSYTLNFLGITPAGAKIIDSKNFITTPADLAVGKFSYKFPKEAAGSKGVYDVAYFRLKTTSGATSTIDLNLRVLGGIDLTADEVKDYITVDDILLNTLVAEVFKKVDAKVDQHLATVKKGDTGPTGPQGPRGVTGPKGDKGDTGATGSPATYQTNLLVNSDFYYDLQGWDTTNNTSGANQPYASYINKDVNARLVGFNTTGYTDRKYSRLRQTINLANNPTGSSKITLQWQSYANKITTYAHLFMRFFTRFDGKGNSVSLVDAGDSHSKVGDTSAMWDWADKTVGAWEVRHGTVTIPDKAKSVQLSFETVEGNILYLANPMLAFGDSISTYTSGPYYPKDDITNLMTSSPKLNGNNMYVGDNTYMGTNTFMDGLSLNGKNVVNGVTDTDWQKLSLNAGYGGSIKYRYHMGALYLGIDDLTGIQAGIDKSAGRIPNYTTSKYHRFPIIIAGKGVITGTVSTNGTIYMGSTNGINLTDTDKGFATVTVL